MPDKRDPDGRGQDKLHSLQDLVETRCDTSPPTTLPNIEDFGIGSAPTQVIHGQQTEGERGSSAASASVSHNRASFPGQLGRYSYVRVLGKGAFGTVLQVWDPELQTHRAIKVPHRELLTSGRVDPESYVREARKVAQLGKHPGIVEVLDVQRLDDGVPYVVSEYISGGSLAERMQAGRIPWRRGGGDRGPHRRRHCPRAQQGHRPPRSEAGQHSPDRGRPARGGRLRPGLGRRGVQLQVERLRHVPLHESAAGPRRGEPRGRPLRISTAWA